MPCAKSACREVFEGKIRVQRAAASTVQAAVCSKLNHFPICDPSFLFAKWNVTM
jgi:hypothetical protein